MARRLSADQAPGVTIAPACGVGSAASRVRSSIGDRISLDPDRPEVG
jgi:hypothetical protein